jgi:ABC-type phosphate transport system substrate-binding protein
MKNRLAALVVASSLAIVPTAIGAVPFTVIVNAGVKGKSISRETLTQVFLGRIDRWSDGRPVTPVDLSATSEVRASFSQAALGMSVFNVRGHWLRALSAGRRPPLTRATDAEVIAFVASNSGGIGYVAEGAVLPDTVRVLVVE